MIKQNIQRLSNTNTVSTQNYSIFEYMVPSEALGTVFGLLDWGGGFARRSRANFLYRTYLFQYITHVHFYKIM